MRCARQTKFVFDDQGTLAGVFLKADFVAEHEWGIKGIQQALHIKPEGRFGADARKVRRAPKMYINYFEVKKEKAAYLVVHRDAEFWTAEKVADRNLRMWDYIRESDEAGGAFGENGFIVRATGDAITHLQAIHDAILRKDAIVMMGGFDGENPFDRGGLAIGILSRLPQDILDEMTAFDKNQHKLRVTANKTHIFRTLEKAGRGYYALTPRWKRDIHTRIALNGREEFSTAYDVVFWLNPHDQQNCRSGWYTVEELKLWAQGKGPIVKNRKDEGEELLRSTQQ